MKRKKKKKYINIIIIVCLATFDILVLLGFVSWCIWTFMPFYKLIG